MAIGRAFSGTCAGIAPVSVPGFVLAELPARLPWLWCTRAGPHTGPAAGMVASPGPGTLTTTYQTQPEREHRGVGPSSASSCDLEGASTPIRGTRSDGHLANSATLRKVKFTLSN